MNNGNVESLRGVLKNVPEDVVKDALAIVLSSHDVSGKNSVDMRTMESERIKDIFELFAYIKRSYSFPELDRFILEGGKLIFKDGDKRIVMAEKTVHQQYSATKENRKSEGIKSDTTINDESKKIEDGDGPERFRRLELDD